MSAVITLRGRLGADPVSRETKNGKEMVTASIAVSLPTRESDEAQWFKLIAFGRTAEVLGKHGKGDALAIMGNLQLNVWTTKDGEERRDLQVLVEALMTPRRARAVANGTPSKKVNKEKSEPKAEAVANADESAEPFDDDIPF